MAFEITEPAKYLKVKTPLDFRAKRAKVEALESQAENYKVESIAKRKAIEEDADFKRDFQMITKKGLEEGKDEETILNDLKMVQFGKGKFDRYKQLEGLQLEAKTEKAKQQKAQLEAQALQQKETDGYLLPIAAEGSIHQIKLSEQMLRMQGKNDKADFLVKYLQENEERLMTMPEEQRAAEIRNGALSLMSPDAKKSALEKQGKIIGVKHGDQTTYMREEEALGKTFDTPSSKGGKNASPFYTFIPGEGGEITVGNNRTGTLETGVNPATGKPFVHGRVHPETQGNIAYRKKEAGVFAEKDALAKYNLPDAELASDYIVNLLDQAVGSPENYDKNFSYSGKGKVKRHKGFTGYVGFTKTPGMRLVEGSPEASYQSLHEQIRGNAFKSAFETLKGGGQISNTEGEAATQALTRLSKAQDEKEYAKAAIEFRTETLKLLKLARKRAAVNRFVKKKPKSVKSSTIAEEMARRGLK